MNTLKQICGDGFCDDAATQQAAAIQGIAPRAICAPIDEKQASEVIRYAIAQRQQLAPLGSGTQQASSGAPQKDFVALSTRRFNQLVDHEPGDMVATAQAGMELAAFQAKLAERGQWLPVSGNPKSTIGGLIATDFSGPLAYGYGTLRDQVLGMRIVNGDGVVRKCGGKVVKNVTGFPLEKLYIGSFGTLGLVTEVTFKLRPFPALRQSWTVELSGNARAGFDVLKAIDAKNLPLEILQLDGPTPLRVTVLASGTTKELDRIDSEVTACGAAFTRANLATTWDTANTGTTPPSYSVGATVRFWSLAAALENCVSSVVQVHPAARYSVSTTSGRIELPQASADVAARVGAALNKQGANFRFEQIRGINIAEPFGAPRGDWALMQRIRASLDPHGLFNSGRFVV